MVAKSENHEGLRGMMNPARYGWERVAYWLQRLSGLGLLAYLIGHIYETSSIVDGKASWDKMLEVTQTPAGEIILTLVIGMCVFHTANGIRVMLGYGGIGIGKPGQPEYPYKATSLNYKQRLCIWVSIALAAFAMMYGLGIMLGD